jgi:carbamate kinase
MSTDRHKRTAVVALGGNAITQPGQDDTIANQFSNTRLALDGIIDLLTHGYRVVITHGNGPQVGNALLRIELSRGKAPVLPLGVCVADTEGGMGYMIAQSLQNRLKQENISLEVVTVITQMIVDEHDPAVANPAKYVGQFYTEAEAKMYSETRDWVMKQDGNRGWRRVVPSPIPTKVVEAPVIRQLVESDVIVIAAGGGGIPVFVDHRGLYEGMDAVIDKDISSAVLGREIGAEILCILTGVERVAINFGKPDQIELNKISVSELKQYAAEGHFPAGSMGPKVAAAIKFIESGGEMVAITSLNNARRALAGEGGTIVVP